MPMEAESKKYILYVKDSCSFCTKAKELLNIYELSYEVIALDADPKAFDEMKSAWKWETVPMIFEYEGIDPIGTVEFIGGYTDLKKKITDE